MKELLFKRLEKSKELSNNTELEIKKDICLGGLRRLCILFVIISFPILLQAQLLSGTEKININESVCSSIEINKFVPPSEVSDQQAINYIHTVWDVTDLSDETLKELLPATYDGIPYKDWIKFFIEVPTALEALQDGDYAFAAKESTELFAEGLIDRGLAKVGLSGVASIANLAALPIELSLKKFENMVSSNEFEKQRKRYFQLRDHFSCGYIEEAEGSDALFTPTKDINLWKNSDGWLLSFPFATAPAPAGITSHEFFTYVEQMWRAKNISESNFQSDESTVRDQFLNETGPGSGTPDEPKPDIESITPSIFVGKPSPDRTTLRIEGSGFTSESSLKFFGRDCPPCISDDNFLRIVDENTIEYDILTGQEPGTWYVEVMNETKESVQAESFEVLAGGDNTAPNTPTNLITTPDKVTNQEEFRLTWDEQSDVSGIHAAWFKIGSPPSSPSDGTRDILYSDNPLPVTVTSEGSTSIYVWLEDGAGNKDHTNRASVVVERDVVLPEVTIQEPVQDPSDEDIYPTQSEFLDLEGVMSDTQSEIILVIWINSRGGMGTGDFSGSTWTLSDIPLYDGINAIGALAVDAAGNIGYDILGVEYNGGDGGGDEGPDLVVEDYDVDPSSGIPGDEIDISFVIANRGNDNVSSYADGNYWSVDYYLSNDQMDSDDDIDLGGESYNTLQQLGPGWQDNIHESEEIPNIEPGDYFILFVADGGNDVEESDENNNLKHLSFTVESIEGGDGPDLVIENPSVNPTDVAPGDEVEISYILANRGNRDVNDYIDESVSRWEIAHYLSEDGNLDMDEDIRLGDEKLHGPASSFLMPRRDPGWTDDIDEYEQIPVDIEPGEYTILIVADEESEVQESNEGNNIEPVKLIIANPIPSVPTGLTFYPNGNSVDLSWNANSETDLAGYNLYRGLDPGSLSLLQNIDSSQSSYTDSEIEGVTTYYYAISAVDNDGNESSLSAWVSYIHDQLTINDDWQLVSNPAKESKNLTGVTTYGFDGAYHSDNSLTAGKGYWVRSNNEETVTFRNEGMDEMEIQLQEGWNLIGSLVGNLNTSAIEDSENILGAPLMYRYSIQNGYESAYELEPKQGYWLYADQDGTIILSLDAEAAANPAKTIEVEKPVADILIFSNQAAEQDLHYITNTLDDETRRQYLLPPVAPEAALDVRTENGFKALGRSNNTIDLTSKTYPVQIRLKSNAEGLYAYRIIAENKNENKELTLTSSSPVMLQKGYQRIRIEQLLEEEVILENALEPNYPNPFNNSTTIRYKLAQTSQVKLNVYDLAGRKVKTLIDARQSSGEYSQRFNTSGLASGIYFIRLKVNNQILHQKISLIK